MHTGLICFSPSLAKMSLAILHFAPQVIGRDGSEISANARDEVMAVGKEAFVQVGKVLFEAEERSF